MMTDAETTVKFGILDGLSSSFGGSPERMVEAVYKSITAPELVWALQELINEIAGEDS